jgi:hypothetical protein
MPRILKFVLPVPSVQSAAIFLSAPGYGCIQYFDRSSELTVMLLISWIIGLLALLATVAALPWLCAGLMRSMREHWRNSSAGGSAFNPLLEFVQPRSAHVVEVREQRMQEDGEGGAAD